MVFQADQNKQKLKIHEAQLLLGVHEKFYSPADKQEASGEQKLA